jgi:hypothetical protein
MADRDEKLTGAPEYGLATRAPSACKNAKAGSP